MAERADLSAPTPLLESTPDPEFYLHAFAQIPRISWAVRALHGRDKVETVHASFVTTELLAPDTKQRDATRRLAAGVETLVLAGRFAMAGGERLSIHGNRTAGHDIRVVTPEDVLLVERKDRAFEPGLNDTMDSRTKRVVSLTRSAGTKIPKNDGAVRVLAIGFLDLVRAMDTDRIGSCYSTALRDAFTEKTKEPLADLPDYVIVEHLGLEAKTGGEKTEFHAYYPVSRRAPILRIEALLGAAMRQGPREF